MEAILENKILDYAKAILFGVAVGDALGVPVEFESRQTLKVNPVSNMRAYGTYKQPKGTWSDDSSMTFCLADALTHNYNLNHIAQITLKWITENLWTPHGEIFDVGLGTRQALLKLYHGVSPRESGGEAEGDNGNGSLMRILPLVFELQGKSTAERFAMISEISGITHNHIRSHLACFYYLEFALKLLNGEDKFTVYQLLKIEMQNIIQKFGTEGEFLHFKRLVDSDIFQIDEDEIQSSGYVIHTLEASIWCLLTTDNYQNAVLKAVNLGEDTDTTAAVTGGIAALAYGFSSIPAEWIETVARKDDIETLAESLAKRYMSEI